MRTHIPSPLKFTWFFLAMAAIWGCTKEIPPPANPSEPVITGIAQSPFVSDSVDSFGDPTKGLDLYLGKTPDGLDQNGRACVNCHLSPTGIDIVQFGRINERSQDSIVMLRGMEHLGQDQVYHIAAYLKSLNITPNGNAPINALIGMDPSNGVPPAQLWNGTSPLTVAQIESWNFRNGISYSFEFPRWFSGDETNERFDDNLDWLPEADLLTAKGEILRSAYENYRINPTKENLRTVIETGFSTLTEGEKNPGEHGFNDFEWSFDAMRWLATLYLQHIMMPQSDLAFGEELPGTNLAEFSLADGIWDVGNIARRSQDNGSNLGNGDEIENRLLNEVQWLYLGWLTNYGKRNSFESQYIGTALKDFGERDLASLVILKSLLHRSAHSQRMYDDVFTMGYITSDALFYESLVFGLDFLIDGILSGNPHFTLLNQGTIDISMGVLLNADPNSPDLAQFVNEKNFLSSAEKSALTSKIHQLHTLLGGM